MHSLCIHYAFMIFMRFMIFMYYEDCDVSISYEHDLGISRWCSEKRHQNVLRTEQRIGFATSEPPSKKSIAPAKLRRKAGNCCVVGVLNFYHRLSNIFKNHQLLKLLKLSWFSWSWVGCVQTTDELLQRPQDSGCLRALTDAQGVQCLAMWSPKQWQ